MAEEFVKLVKIGLDKSFINDSIANADKLTKSINELKEVKKKEGQLSAEQEGRVERDLQPKGIRISKLLSKPIY
jgi:hypothetical protein